MKVGNPGFPYSVPGSFLTVNRCEKGKYKCNTYPGLWIRNVSTCWKDNFCRLVPSVGDKDVEVTECVMRDGWLEAKTDKGAIEFAYLRPDVMLVRSKSSEMHIRFEYQRPRQKYDFPSTFGRTVDYMHFSADRILMDTRTGVRDPDGGNTVRVHPSKEGIEVAILDIHTGDKGLHHRLGTCLGIGEQQTLPPRRLLERSDLGAFHAHCGGGIARMRRGCAGKRDFAQVLQACYEVRFLRKLRREDRRGTPRPCIHVDRLRVPRSCT